MPEFAVACGHRVTADAAAEVLRAGGSAVDGAIAAALVCMVAEPALAGLLGGGFLMVREPGGRSRCLDFFVDTPRRRRPEHELDFRAIEAQFGTATQEFHIGAGSVATPGVAPGLAEAHARFGRMPMTELVAPGVAAARWGVPVSEYQSFICGIIRPILTATPAARALFCQDDRLMPEGFICSNPDFADVLEVFAHEGARFVTEGEVAQALLTVCDKGGHLGRADLTGYRPEWRTPLTAERAGVRVAVNPPPSLGGALALFALQLLGRDPDGVALARAFAATTRARIEADLSDPVEGVGRLLSPAFVERYRRELLGRPVAQRGTTHISVIDAGGMGAALTLTNGEGCGLIVPGTGIMPNNMLGEADLVPGGWHTWRTGSRLASMIAPMVVDWPDGGFAVLGSGGSNRIRTALAQVLVALIDRGESLEPAVEAPRLHVEPGTPDELGAPTGPPAVEFEDLAGEAARDALLAAFPQARAWPELSMYFGGVHGARRHGNGAVEAAGDPRRAGVALTG